MTKLPFVAGIFWKVLVAVAVLVVLVFVIAVKFTEYERTTTDTVGATITGLIFSYLLHLWMLPAEYLHPDDEYDEYDEDYEEDEEDGDEEHSSDESDPTAEDDTDESA